ncbi:MAG: heme NO-binding domain-containing protein [Myxococcota bacterium]
MEEFMLGLIPKILYDMVRARVGDAAADALKESIGLPVDRTFRLNDVYPDDGFRRMAAAAQAMLKMPDRELWDAYADAFCRDALQRWPTWWSMSKSARELLERQPTIHNCFATGVQDPAARNAITDKFLVERRQDELVTHYRSPNWLCALYEALARWVLRYYGETAHISQSRCMNRGDPECEIHIRWAPN